MPNLSTLAPAWERARERGSYDDCGQYILTESQKYLQLWLSEYFACGLKIPDQVGNDKKERNAITPLSLSGLTR
jgi:hypothetical protein